MKKIISVILALVFAFCFSVNAFAETVELEEYKLSLEVPEGWYAVTKDTPEDSEIFEYYVYYDAAMELFEEYGIAAYIISEDGYSEIFFELSQTEIYEELGELSKTRLEKYMKELEEEWTSYGYENCSVSVHEGEVTTFVTVNYDYYEAGSKVYGLDYIGYIDGIYCVISFYDYEKPISESETELMNKLTDSIISENVVPENNSSNSGAVRALIKSVRRLVPVVIALVAGLVAKAKGLFGKNKKTPPEAEVPSFEATKIKTESSEQIDNNFEDDLSANISESGFCCSSCGSPLSEDDKFCPLCGKKIK